MLWGHYWMLELYDDPAMVAKPEYRGTGALLPTCSSSCVVRVDLSVPSLFAAIGRRAPPCWSPYFPLIGLLAAIFILPEGVRVRAD